MLNVVFAERVRGRGRGRGRGHKRGFSWHTQGVVTGAGKMASYFSGREVAPPDVGLRSLSPGSAFRCPVGGVVENPSPPPRLSPLPASVVPRPGTSSRSVGVSSFPVRVAD